MNSILHLRNALNRAQTALESWNQSAVQDAVAERHLSDFIARCTAIVADEMKNSYERIHRFDKIACIQSCIVSSRNGESMRVFSFHPRDDIEYPYITETMYGIVKKKLCVKDESELYTTEDYPVYVVDKNERILRTIRNK